MTMTERKGKKKKTILKTIQKLYKTKLKTVKKTCEKTPALPSQKRNDGIENINT